MPGTNPKFSSLSPAFQHLARTMQSMGYGKLRNLPIRDGEPIFEQAPTPNVVRLIKLGKFESGHTRTTPLPMERDYVLDRSILELITHVRGLKAGTIERLEIMHGLPVLLELAEPMIPLPSNDRASALTRMLAN